MIVLMHILFALGSVGLATATFIKPSTVKLYASYAMVAGTIVSGTFLVVHSHARMLEACTSGLVYVGAVGTPLLLARTKLAHTTK